MAAKPKQLESETWTCHVCHRERPDEQIGVARHEHKRPSGFIETQSVRYCRDNSRCTTSALLHDHTELALDELTRESARLRRQVAARPWVFGGGAVCGGLGILLGTYWPF